MSTHDQPRHQLEVHLLATAGLMRRAYDARLAELGLNITESGLLQFLRYEQPLSQSELAERLHIGKMAAGTVVKALEKRALVRRERDPDDGRAWLITLTPTGDDAASACIDVDAQVVAELRTSVSKQDQRALRNVLDVIAANAIRVVDDAGDAQPTP